MLIAIWESIKDISIGLIYIAAYILIALLLQLIWNLQYLHRITRGRNTDYLP